MPEFKNITSTEPISEIIKSTFDMDIDIVGGWGYTPQEALILSKPIVTPIDQLQHTIASMRTHIEMSMTRPPEQRYGGINLQETERETISKNDCKYEKVSYKVTAMLESDYAKFISEYKEGYGSQEFDISTHFENRKKATLSRDIDVWFSV